MARSRTAGLVAGGLLLLGAGFLLGRLLDDGPHVETPRVTIPEIVKAPPPDPPPKPIAVVAAPPDSAPSSAPDPLLSAADREALRAILERIPPQAVPTGTGVIGGTIQTEDGQPVAGVDVRCSPEPPRPPRAYGTPTTDPDPVDSVSLTYQWARFRRDSGRSAASDAAGMFRFEGLGDVRHRMEFRKKGWQFRTKDPRATYEARPGATIAVVATPSVEVRIEVACPGGTAPENLMVSFRSGGGSGSEAYGFRPENPVVQVKPGVYQASVQAGNMKSEEQSVEIVPEGETPTLRFVLKGRPGIQGRVVFPPGEFVDQARVVCLRLASGQKAEPAVFASGGLDAPSQGGGEGYDRDSGRYLFTDLAPGRYAVGVVRLWNTPPVGVAEVEVADGMAERDLQVPPLQISEYVALTVLGPDGSLLRDYQVTTGYRSAHSSSSGGSSAAMRPDGTRWVLHHSSGQKEEADGTWWIEVASPKYGSKRGEYRRGEQDSMTLKFEEPARVEVRLEGYVGHSHVGRLRVNLQPRTSDTPGNRALRMRYGEEVPGDDGVQTFPQVQPGEYEVVLALATDRMPLILAKATASIHAGRNEVVLRVPVLHAVTVTGGEGSLQCRSKSDPYYTIYGTCDAEGKAILDGLVEGEYEVRSNRKAQTFRVPGTTDVKL